MRSWPRKLSNSWNDMSLLRLLASGRSLVGLGNSEHRYHLANRRAMPTFSAKENPFRATVRPESTSSAKAQLQVPAVSEAPVETQAELQANPPTPAPNPLTAKDADKVQVKRPSRMIQQGASAIRSSAEKLKGLFRRGPSSQQSSAVPRFAKPLIQGELSLDRIKVVRNDLSDSDIEIVPVKPESTPAAPAETKPEHKWKRVAGQLFGAGKG